MVFDLIFFLVLFSAVYLTGLYFFIRFILLSERDQTEAVVSLSVGGVGFVLAKGLHMQPLCLVLSQTLQML